MINVEETRVAWTCPECGREHVQKGKSDKYCVCKDGRVALGSDDWRELQLIRVEDVLDLMIDLVDEAESKGHAWLKLCRELEEVDENSG